MKSRRNSNTNTRGITRNEAKGKVVVDRTYSYSLKIATYAFMYVFCNLICYRLQYFLFFILPTNVFSEKIIIHIAPYILIEMAEFHEEEFEGSVEVEDGRSFFLVRIPKNINITQLNNVRIKKMKASNDIDALKGDGGSTYSLQIGPDVGLSNFRPIVSEDGKAAVGPKFAGCLTVTRKFALQQSEDAVPVRVLVYICIYIFMPVHFTCAFVLRRVQPYLCIA